MKKPTFIPDDIATVWPHWKGAFKKSRFLLLGAMIGYSIPAYLDLLLKPSQWKNIYNSLVKGEDYGPAFQIIVMAVIASWIVKRFADYCIVLSESKIIQDLRDYTLKGLLGKSTHFFYSHSSGGLVAKAKRFAASTENVVDEFMFSLIQSFFFIVYLVVYLCFVIPKLALVFFLWVITFMVLIYAISKIRLRYDLESSKADSLTTGHLSDILLSVFTLRVFSATPREYEKFQATVARERQKRLTSWFIGNVQWAIQGFLVGGLEIFCMKHMIDGVHSGSYQIGQAVEVQTYMGTLIFYMWGFGRSIVNVRTRFTEAYEMAHLLDEEETEPIIHEPHESTGADNSIALHNIHFSYVDGIKTLNNFSFMFHSGRRYGLIGKTGSGKSTVTKLILRLYDPEDGIVCVQGTDVRELDKNRLRSWISYVPQNPIFPSITVREIIRLGRPEATNAEVREAAEKACCNFIWEQLSDEFDTQVGERGVKLSGGECQRLAIAAAILKDAPIVIMDEPTSALDARTEQSIQDSIRQHFKNKTLIVIAHRLSTVAILDEILVLKHGQILESGSHNHLLAHSREYREMWEMQTNPHVPSS